MNIRQLRKWFDDIAADADHFLETYWRNVGAIVVILLLWVLIVAPRSSDQFLPDPLAWNNAKDQEGWWFIILFLIFVYAVVTRLFAWVNNEAMVNLWVAVWCVGLFYLATDPIAYYTGRPYKDSWTFALHQNFHGWSVLWGACWLGFIASYTLIFIFRHHRVKLWAFWIWFFLNLAIITFFYWWTSFIGVLVAFLTPHFMRPWLVAPSEQTVTLDGRKVSKLRDADRFYRGMRKRKPQMTVLFGGLEIPFSELPTHVVAFGATGSGKTLTLLLLVKNFLYQIYPGSPYKAIIYDAAREAPALLQGMAVGAKVYLLNPLDARSVKWNLAEDFTDLTQAWTLAEILAPGSAGSGENAEYFRKAAVAVLYGIISFYTLNAPGRWGLADIIRACPSETVLQAILQSDERTKDALAVLATDKTSASILSTILTEIKKYAIIAALWETCTESISVKKFLKGGGIAVLGRDEEAPSQVNALNRLWLLKTSQALLNAPSVQEPQTLFLLDETASFKVERLSTMAAELRKKGGFLVLGIQNIRRMNTVYGADETATIVSQCRHKALLRVEDKDTAEFCSELIGDAEVKIMTPSYHWEQDAGRLVGHGEKSGINEQRRFQRAVLPSNFQNIAPVDFDNNIGLTGYFISRFVHRHTYSVQELKELLPRPDDSYPNFVPKDAQFMQLMPWTDADLERLGLTKVFQQLRLKDFEEKLGQMRQELPPVPPVTPPWLGESFEVGAAETCDTEEPEENTSSWYTTQPNSFQRFPRRSPDNRRKRTRERQPRKPSQRREPPQQERGERKP